MDPAAAVEKNLNRKLKIINKDQSYNINLKKQIYIIQLISVFGLLIPVFAVTFRRLHDRDKSGGWAFISFIPIIGTIILLVMLIEKGTEGKNRFGNYPLKIK